jgi:hypothetical protein
MRDIVAMVLMVVYNLTLIVGSVYLIQVYNWNAWWMLLSVILCVSYKRGDDK